MGEEHWGATAEPESANGEIEDPMPNLIPTINNPLWVLLLFRRHRWAYAGMVRIGGTRTQVPWPPEPCILPPPPYERPTV